MSQPDDPRSQSDATLGDSADSDAASAPGSDGDGDSGAGATPEPGADESEWRFGLDEVGPEAEDEPDPIEPGSPSLENVLFVLVGVVGTLLLLSTAL